MPNPCSGLAVMCVVVSGRERRSKSVEVCSESRFKRAS
jgi:hypothetical protein